MGERKLFSRRDFLKLAASGAAVLAAKGVERKLGLGIGTAEAGKEPQLDLPPNTYLTSLPEWQLKLFRGVEVEELELYNGPKNTWSATEFAGVFVVPNKYFENKNGADDEAKEKLRTRLVIRADVTRDETTDKGWDKEELKLIQEQLIPAIKRCEEFFGPSTWNGLVKISRPSKTERKALRNSTSWNIGGAVTGGSFGCFDAVEVGKCDQNNINIVILKSWRDFVSRVTDEERAMQLFMGYIRNLLAHEIGHVWFGGTRLGTPGELGALNNHAVVFTVGASAILSELAGKIVGKEPEELRIGGIDFSDLEKPRPEMLPWKAFKVRGREFYADLLKNLKNMYGEKKIYATNEVSVVANMLFQQVGFKFTYEDMLKAFNTTPDESKIQYRDMRGYNYPLERVAGDPMNPNGEVCWWEEVRVLAPVPFISTAWWRGPIFPDDDGYYRAYKLIGKGSLKDGPPNKNSLAVATWKKGGDVYGSPIPFPVNMDGVIYIRAKNY